MEAMLVQLVILASLPAAAMVETTKETFTGYLDRGQLLLVSDDHAKTECLGNAYKGVVRLSCTDDRAGVVIFRGVVGQGNLDGEPLTVVLR